MRDKLRDNKGGCTNTPSAQTGGQGKPLAGCSMIAIGPGLPDEVEITERVSNQLSNDSNEHRDTSADVGGQYVQAA